MLPARRRLQEREAATCNAQNNAHERSAYEEDKEDYDPNAWKQFGMDTEAGRMLSKLYGRQAKPVINYPKINKRIPQPSKPFIPGGGRVESDPRTAERKKEAALKTAVPKFTCATKYKSEFDRLYEQAKNPAPIDRIPRRKEQSVIRAQTKDIERRNYFHPSTKPVCTEEKKSQLQAINTFQGGRILPQGMLPGPGQMPAHLDPKAIPANLQVPKKGKTEISLAPAQSVHEKRFDELVNEIEERRTFLQRMEELGNAHQWKNKIENEIKEKVKEMEQLHKLL